MINDRFLARVLPILGFIGNYGMPAVLCLLLFTGQATYFAHCGAMQERAKWQRAAEPVFQAYNPNVTPRDAATLAHILQGKPRDPYEPSLRPTKVALNWDKVGRYYFYDR